MVCGKGVMGLLQLEVGDELRVVFVKVNGEPGCGTVLPGVSVPGWFFSGCRGW